VGWNYQWKLLSLAENKFDLFITSDQSIPYQQNLAGRQIAILELSTNDLRRIRNADAELLQAIETVKPGEFRQLRIR
jgi:hypothetical protein